MNNSEAVIRIRKKAKERLKYDLVYEVHGARGRSIRVYPYKCIISTSVTAGSLLTNNATDGEKTIYYKDVIGIQYKRSGITIGYLQFETASGTMNNEKSNFFSENTFTFEANQAEIMEEVYEYVIGIFDELSKPPIVNKADNLEGINIEKLNTLIEYQYRELINTNPEYQNVQAIYKEDVAGLEKEVSDALRQYNEVRTEVKSLNDSIQKYQEQIEKRQAEITRLKAYGKSSGASEKIRVKEGELTELEQHISGLKKDKEELSKKMEQKKEYHSKKYQLLKEKQSELQKAGIHS